MLTTTLILLALGAIAALVFVIVFFWAMALLRVVPVNEVHNPRTHRASFA